MSGFFDKLFSSNNQEKPATTEAGFIESIFGTKKETKTAEEPAPATTEAAPAPTTAAIVIGSAIFLSYKSLLTT